MKVLFLSTNDNSGGAARAAYRLYEALNEHSSFVKCEMLVLKKETDDPNVHKLSESLFHRARPYLESLPPRRYKDKKNVLFSSAWVPFSGITDKINEFKPDIVHLHWINAGLLRIEDLSKINTPIVWSLHDMWAFTGGCHIDLDCGKFKKVCGACPVLNSAKERDLSQKIFKRKLLSYSKIQNLTIVGLSKWLCKCAKESTLLKERHVVNLPNPIDINVYKKIAKRDARKVLSLEENKKYILFGAMSATSNPNKGFKELIKALALLEKQNESIELLVFGASRAINVKNEFEVPVNYLGKLHDDVTLILMYNAADVVVVPSKQENLSNVIMESLACGTPVVGFNIGGNGDMIEHKVNGYLAEPYSSKDLANGISWVLNHTDSDAISESARNKIITDFRMEKIALAYENLYKGILEYE